ncbi:MAG: mucoidy inhibitor MuiA family protein [Candidatus Firestonebacteria bacterium]|nr:mucoidy inhibitor MuiA family protein [Candidatus Firestonebacteria bacterium]
MSKNKWFLKISAGVILLSVGMYAEELVVADSKISEVTVYSDRALITRKAVVELKPGSSIISFEKIPQNVDRNSLRVSGADKRVKIQGIDISDKFKEAPFNPKLAELDDKIEQVKDGKKILEDQLEMLVEKVKYLESLKNPPKGREGESKMTVKEFKEMLSFVEETLLDVSTKQRTVSLEIRKQDKKLDVLNKERNNMARGSQSSYKNADVSVEVSAPGKYGLEVSYVIYGAGWQPIYDVRAGGSNSVEFAYHGLVTQSTGEDWKDVQLSLSTAKPYLAGNAPQLTPWYLSYNYPMVKRDAEDKSMVKPMAAARKMASKKQYYEEEQMEKLASGIDMVRAEMETARTSVFFKIKKKMSIPSDSNPHRVPVAVEKFDAKMEYESAPELSKYAYLKAKIKNTDKPLLAGQMNIFLDDNYVGNSYIKEIPAEKDFDAYLGVDEGITIEKKREQNKESSTGWFLVGTNKKHSRQFKITMQNFKKEPVKIVLTERIPVSQNEEIKVNLVKSSPDASEKTKEGFLKWTVELKPGEKKEAAYEYTIEYPMDKIVPMIGE